MPPPLHPPTFSFIKTFLFLSLLFPTYFASDAEGYTACAPFSCGNFSDISYPFWSENQPDYCGHPKFKLDCQQDNLTIDIMSQKFLIIDLNQTAQILKIARLDLWGDPCPKKYTNVSLDLAFFEYTSNDDKYTLLYDCNPNNPVPYTPSVNFNPSLKFTCPIEGGTGDAYLVPGTNLVDFNILGCQFSITVPVLRVVVESSIKDGLDVEYVLDEGFEVGWGSLDRDQCVESSIKIVGNVSKYLGNTYSWERKAIIGVASATMGGLLIGFAICYFRCKPTKWQKFFWLTTKSNQDIEEFLKDHGGLALKRYKFTDVKKMTNSFKVKLGQGGFGVVYQGMLLTGCPVAVKILNESKTNGEEFINEVASISKTSHINVVTLLGFCLEGRKKALIYEFVANGSLENFIYKKGPQTTSSLSWDNLHQIAVGIARGLEYLHKGCNTRILHFDIKPHNILLDENLCPKISDFGLAKLCPRKESVISLSDARGTMGYVAPEVWNRHFGGVSHKSDVYSYGMMLLEMVGGRKNIDADASHTSEIYFPHWVYRRLELGANLGLDGVVATEENEITKRMTVVGLWCIQTFPHDRPAMSKVVDMLEGSMNSLEMPPKPILSSTTRSVVESSTTLN